MSMIFPLADLKTAISVIVVLVAIIGWITQLIQDNKKPVAPKRGPGGGQRPRNPQVQQEIEEFLQQVTGKKPAAKAAGDAEVEVVRPSRQPAGSRQPPKKGTATVSAGKPAKAAKPGELLRERHVQSAGLGKGVAEHVKTHLDASRLTGTVAKDVPHDVEKNVTEKFGEFAAAKSVVQPRQDRSLVDLANLVRDLKNPKSFRTAFLMTEILSRPRSRRKRGD